MLRLIDRYLVTSFLLPLVYCMLAFNILFVAYDMSDNLKDFLNKQVSAEKIAAYYVYYVPIVITLTMPFATLLAMLYCLGNMSRNNEIIAMRASGIPLFRIVRPYLVLGGAMYLGTLLLGEAFVPRARRLAAQIMFKPTSVALAIPVRGTEGSICYYNVQDNRQWTAKEMDVAGGVLRGVHIVQYTRSKDRRKTRSIEADRAEYDKGFGWVFYNVKRLQYLSDETSGPVRRLRRLSMPHQVYPETLQDIVSAQRTEPDMMTFDEIGSVIRSVSSNSDTYRKLRMERQKRVALPATCIVFVLLAAPFGIFHTRAGMVKGVITSIGLCVVYYIVAAWFVNMGVQGHMLPLVAAWLPNITFAGLGTYLLYCMR